jgi:hypothetical protein
MTLEDCKAKCFENCSCSAYSSLDSTGAGSGCSIWFGDLVDLRVLQSGNDLYIRVDASNTGNAFKIHFYWLMLYDSIKTLLIFTTYNCR